MSYKKQALIECYLFYELKQMKYVLKLNQKYHKKLECRVTSGGLWGLNLDSSQTIE